MRLAVLKIPQRTGSETETWRNVSLSNDFSWLREV